jgi:Zn ribbon nucleic-acid-binding protein
VDDTRRANTDELPFLDVRELKRDGFIDQGHEQLEGIAPLAWTSCTFGGSRPWFICPRCDQRAAILYWDEEEMPAGELLCRRCLDLGYQSQREGLIARAKRRVEKARLRLAPDGGRLKGMHHATFLEAHARVPGGFGGARGPYPGAAGPSLVAPGGSTSAVR